MLRKRLFQIIIPIAAAIIIVTALLEFSSAADISVYAMDERVYPTDERNLQELQNDSPDVLANAVVFDNTTLDQVPKLKNIMQEALAARDNGANSRGNVFSTYVSHAELFSIKLTLKGNPVAHMDGALIKYNGVYYSFLKSRLTLCTCHNHFDSRAIS